MFETMLGSKGKMNQTFVKGRRVTVTKVTVGPCVVTQIKTLEKDGYWAIQLGYGQKKSKNITKALKGHLKKVTKENKAPNFLAEVRFSDEPKGKEGKILNVGDTVVISDIFNVGDVISVSGISKGKGFAGNVKRWHFAGGPRTHGQSDRERAPGAISSGTTPGRVRKGKHMAGHMGNKKTTIQNLQVISVNPETSEMEVSGPIPGVNGGFIIIKRVSKGELEGISQVQAQVVEGEDLEDGVKGEEKPNQTPEVKEEPKKEENK